MLTPSHYQFAVAQDPFIVSLATDDTKRPTTARLIGESSTAASGGQLEMHEKILAYLREHPGTTGSGVAKGIHANKEWVLDALDTLEANGAITHVSKGQGNYWSVVPTSQE